LIPLSNSIDAGSYQISAMFYNSWLNSYQAFVVVTLIFCVINVLLGFYEKDIELLIFSLIGIVIDIGIILYLQKGIFLFLHQPGSTESVYLISVLDLTVFSILNLISLFIALFPHIYKLFKFIKIYWKFIYISSKDAIENESG
jgi:hypothetical protein